MKFAILRAENPCGKRSKCWGRHFQHYFSDNVAASAYIHAFLQFPLPKYSTVFFPKHCLLSRTTVVEPVVSSERGINFVAMTIINYRKEISQAGDQTSDLLPRFDECFQMLPLLLRVLKTQGNVI